MLAAIFWTIVVLFIVFLIIGFLGIEEEKKRTEASQSQQANARRARDEYLEQNGIQDPAEVTLAYRSAWLFFDAAKNHLTLISYRLGTEFEILAERTIDPATILEVTVKRDSREERFTRTVITPVAVAKKKSAVGRGLIGGALLGPAGLVLGAASAIAPSTKVVEHSTKMTDTRVVDGPPTLVLALDKYDDPLVKIEFKSPELAEKWLHRLKKIVSGLDRKPESD